MLRVHGIQISSAMMTTIPVSIGTLWAYLSTKLDIFQHLELTGFSIHVEDTVLEFLDDIKDPDIILCTLYMWNRNRTNKITRAIKEKYPNCKIVVGGNDLPQNIDRFKKFAKKNPQYDYYVWGEGEIALENIIRKELKKDFDNSCFSYYDNGIFKIQSQKKYLNHKEDLLIPSPCAMGIFDPIIEKYKGKIEIQGVLETNRGCPYSCTFCDWGLEEKLRKFSMTRIKQEIDWMVDNVQEMMIADANFGILKRDVEIAKYIVNRKLRPGSVMHSTNVTYAKNNKERVLEIAEIMEKYDLNRAGASFSLQTLNPATSTAIKRDDIKTISNMQWIADNFSKRGLAYYNEIIMGLPMETKQSYLDGVEKLLDYNPFEIHMYKLAMLENSEMNLQNHQEKYGMKFAKFVQGPSKYEDEEEITWLISSTNTMSANDMKHLRKIRDMVQTMWFGKITMYIMRYLKQKYNIKFIDFLENINKHLSNSDFGQLLDESLIDVREKTIIPKMYYNYHKKAPFQRYVNNWLYLRKNLDELYQNIKNMLYTKYPNIDFDQEELDDILHFNKEILIDIEVNQYKTFVTKYNWINFFRTEKLIKEKTVWDMEVYKLGTPAYQPSHPDALFYAAGGHNYIFNKQSAFTYQRGTVNGEKFTHRVGRFFYPHESLEEDLPNVLLV
jgi:putative methyltransferase